MNPLLSRITVMEDALMPTVSGYVVLKAEGETERDAIAAAGIVPNPRDLVILVCRYSPVLADAKRLLSKFGMSS